MFLRPPRRERPDDRPAHEDSLRTERESDDDVRAAPDAAVEQKLNANRDRFDDARQHVQARRHAVELAPSVVRDDDARDASIAGARGVLSREHTLQDNGNRDPFHERRKDLPM